MSARLLVFGAALALGAAALGAARALRWLTAGGCLAAAVVGAAALAAPRAGAVALLLLFFVSTSWLTSLSARHRGATRGDHHGRTARQVAAKGGVAAACALLARAGVPWAEAAFAGALAAATADSWATEVGTAAAGRTWRLVGGGWVAPGRTGGISAAGTAAAVAGAALLAAAACGLARVGLFAPAGFLPILVAGVGGMAVDSALGGALAGRVRAATGAAVHIAATATGAVLAALLAG